MVGKTELNLGYIIGFIACVIAPFTLILIFLNLPYTLTALFTLMFALTVVLLILRHYKRTDTLLAVTPESVKKMRSIAEVSIVPINRVTIASIRTVEYAKRFSKQVYVVHIYHDEEIYKQLLMNLDLFPTVFQDTSFVFLEPKRRDMSTSIIEFANELSRTKYNGQIVTVVIPEYITNRLVTQPLYANSLRMKSRQQENIILVDIRFSI